MDMTTRRNDRATATMLLTRLSRCRRGQGLAEYGVLLALISIGAAASSVIIEDQLRMMWARPSSVLASMSGTGGDESESSDPTAHALTNSILRSDEPGSVVVAIDEPRRSSRNVDPPWLELEVVAASDIRSH